MADPCNQTTANYRTCPRCLSIMPVTQDCTCDAEELAWDIDKLVGTVIDAYTLAPNDEDEKREAVKSAIIRWAIKRAFDAVVADARRIIVSADNLRERLQERLAND